MRSWIKIGDLPIRKKLRLFNLLTSLVSGILSVLLLILVVWNVEYHKAEHAARIKAAIIAENAMPALRFRDARTAEEILAGLSRDAEILDARIVEPDGTTFAAFKASRADRVSEAGVIQIHVSAPMESGGEQLATLELSSDRGYVIGQIFTYIGAVVLSTIFALLIGGFLAVRLQRAITNPLSVLVALMKEASVGADFSQRASIINHDELGELSRSFNLMIEQIEQRNKALGEELAERRRAAKRLEYVAHHDQVTGLPNRHFFRKRTAELMRDKATSDRSRALLFVDLDNFKYINDTFGHDSGDQLLVVVADRLSAAVRTYDMVVRFGGDEFVIVLEHITDLTQAQFRANKLLEVVTQPFKLAEREIFVTCSIGVAIAPEHGDNFEELLQKADAAMYVAKGAGKNGVQLWEPSISSKLSARFELETDLHQALENGQLEMYYQPIVCLASGRIAGMEALMRWHHPVRGFIPPDIFIPIAEDNGSILALGEWAMRSAFTQAAVWNKRFGPLFIAVNVSGRQFCDPDFIIKTEKIAFASELAREMCELEVTESIVMENSGEAVRILDELSKLGFSLSLDDFGTGYSSLAYLKRFSLDKLKIDRSFVTDLPDDMENVAIAKVIIGLARTLSMRTVSEGIETIGQAEMLHSIGGQYGQGYLFSRPLPITRMEAFISENQAARASGGAWIGVVNGGQ